MTETKKPGQDVPETEAPEETQAQAQAEGEADAAAPEPTPEEQIAELRDKLLRAMAEAENTRRRAEKDRQEAAKFGLTKFARDLLTVADNLRRAIETIPEADRANVPEMAKNLILGVEMIERELLAAFEKHGIRKIGTPGERFDPNLHQAVAEIPDTGQPDGAVVEVFQTGYVCDDRLLRPAMVTVAKGAKAQPADGQPADPGASVDTTA